MNRHVNVLGKVGFKVEDIVILSSYANVILKIEKAIKTTFYRHEQEIVGFKTEATHLRLYDNVLTFAKNKLEEYEKDVVLARETLCQEILKYESIEKDFLDSDDLKTDWCEPCNTESLAHTYSDSTIPFSCNPMSQESSLTHLSS